MSTTYGGGGRFVGNRQVILRGAGKTHPLHPLQGVEVVSGEAPYHRSTREVEDADWSGRDQQNRLVFGCAARNRCRAGGLSSIPSPAQAKRAMLKKRS
jgi:hypothetical protein